MLNIKTVPNSEEIRSKFCESFALSWKEFKADFNEEIKLMTGKGYTLSSDMFHLYDMIAISKETTFSSAINRLKAKEGDVYFMSEKESFAWSEEASLNGVFQKNGVFKADCKELAEAIEKDWELELNGEGTRLLPLDLYVFDETMKKAIVFTGDIAEYEDEEDGKEVVKTTRLCFSCKRRKRGEN